MAERGYENYILVSRIDNECSDLMRVLQPYVLPGFPAVDGFENTGAVGRIAADRSLACADIYHVVIGRRHREGADRRNRCFIEKRHPICPAVSRLPNPAGHRAEIICVRLTCNPFDRQRAPTTKRTDLPPTHAVEQLFVDCSGRRWGRGTGRLNRGW